MKGLFIRLTYLPPPHFVLPLPLPLPLPLSCCYCYSRLLHHPYDVGTRLPCVRCCRNNHKMRLDGCLQRQQWRRRRAFWIVLQWREECPIRHAGHWTAPSRDRFPEIRGPCGAEPPFSHTSTQKHREIKQANGDIQCATLGALYRQQ